MLLTKTVAKIENSKIPLFYFVLFFFIAITVRNFIEPISTGYGWKPDLLIHYYLSYIYLALVIIVLFYFLTKEKIDKVVKIVLPGFVVTILVPILDLILTNGFSLEYLTPGVHDGLLIRYLTFFGPIGTAGISLGVKVEIGLVLLLSLFYFIYKTKNYIKSIFNSLCLYTLIFFYCAMPFTLKFFLDTIHVRYVPGETDLGSKFYLFLIFLLLNVIFFIRNRVTYIALLKNIRPFRLLHFWLMFILGIALLAFNINFSEYSIFFNFIFILISITCAWLFSLIINDIHDVDIDKISNFNRPLIKKNISLSDYKVISYLVLFLALIYSASVNLLIFFLILFFIVNYYIYSAPPLRIKRIPLFSSLLISLNSLLLILVGYNFAGGNILDFPKNVALFVLIFFTACLNFINIKDYGGDKQIGIKTLPTLIGLRKSKLLIGFFFLISFLAIPFFLKTYWLLPLALLFGSLEFYFINRSGYDERPIFFIYLLALIFIIIYFSSINSIYF